MTRDTYNLWIQWKKGLINRTLTKDEDSELRASEFAMHLLFPTAFAEELIDKYGENILENERVLEMVRKTLDIPYAPVFFKLQYTLNQKEHERSKKSTR